MARSVLLGGFIGVAIAGLIMASVAAGAAAWGIITTTKGAVKVAIFGTMAAAKQVVAVGLIMYNTLPFVIAPLAGIDGVEAVEYGEPTTPALPIIQP